MQCPSCSKFPAKDTDNEPEGDLEVDDEGMVTGEIRIVNTSECCGEELEEATFQVEIDLRADVATHLAEQHPKPPAPKKPVKPVKLTAKTVGMDDRCRCGAVYRWHSAKNGRGYVLAGQTDPNTALCPMNKGVFVPALQKGVKRNDGTAELSVTGDLSRTDEMATKDRRGRTITNRRYMRRLYGIHVTATVHCEDCNEDIASGDYADSVSASGMESLV